MSWFPAALLTKRNVLPSGASAGYCSSPASNVSRFSETCGETGYKARVGDIRHNFIFYWPYDSRAPWGGIANWNADPLTGEIIGGAAQIMGRSATFAAAQQRDIIALELGDAKIDDLVEGSQEAMFAKNLTDGHKEAPRALTAEEMKKRTSDVEASFVSQVIDACVSSTPETPTWVTIGSAQSPTEEDSRTSPWPPLPSSAST